jgi:hypothetical protein
MTRKALVISIMRTPSFDGPPAISYTARMHSQELTNHTPRTARRRFPGVHANWLASAFTMAWTMVCAMDAAAYKHQVCHPGLAPHIAEFLAQPGGAERETACTRVRPFGENTDEDLGPNRCGASCLYGAAMGVVALIQRHAPAAQAGPQADKRPAAQAFEYDVELLLTSLPEGKILHRLKVPKAYGFDNHQLTYSDLHASFDLQDHRGIPVIAMEVRASRVGTPTDQDAVTSLFALEKPGRLVGGKRLMDGPQLRQIFGPVLTYHDGRRDKGSVKPVWPKTLPRDECSGEAMELQRFLQTIPNEKPLHDLRIKTSLSAFQYTWRTGRHGGTCEASRSAAVTENTLTVPYDGSRFPTPRDMGPRQ